MRLLTLSGLKANAKDASDLDEQLLRLSHSCDHLAAAKGRKLRELFQFLQLQGSKPEVGAMLLGSELSLMSASGVAVNIVVDWYDHRPFAENGLPAMHYRLQVRREGDKVSKDYRLHTVADVERVLLQLIGKQL